MRQSFCGAGVLPRFFRRPAAASESGENPQPEGFGIRHKGGNRNRQGSGPGSGRETGRKAGRKRPGNEPQRKRRATPPAAAGAESRTAFLLIWYKGAENREKRKVLLNFAGNSAIKSQTRYGIQLQGDRIQVAAALERTEDLPRRGRPLAPEILCARHVPLSVGSRPACGPPAGLHRLGHLLALQAAQGIQRPAPDGLRRLRTSGRAVRHPDGAAPGGNDRAQHRPLPRAAGQDRLLVRLGPRGPHLRPEILQVDPVGLPRDVRPLLRQPPAEGAADRGARSRLCEVGHRGDRRRLHPGATVPTRW